MKNRLTFVLITGLVLLNGTVLITGLLRKEEQQRSESAIREAAYWSNHDYLMIRRAWMYSIASDAHSLTALSLVREHGSADRLRQVVGESEKLVLVVSDQHCDSCVDALLFCLKKNLNQLGRKNLLVLFGAGSGNRNLWESKQLILPEVPFLEIPDKGLGLPADSLHTPYFFVTGPELTTSMTFLPYPTREEHTEVYLNLIANRFTQNIEYE